MKPVNGLEIYQGASAIDGAPIVGLLIGLQQKSTNRKTGGMLQTYIMRADVPPIQAKKTGADVSVCGDCPHRGRSCYVNIGHGPRSVYCAWKRGRYPRSGGAELLERIAASGQALRIGTYGDPGAIPGAGSFWRDLASAAPRHTGYSHRWRDCGASLRGIVMASVDTLEQAQQAQSEGWATFRVAPIGERERIKGEAYCPAAIESGKRTTCDACPIPCDGSVNGISGRLIQAHGASKKKVR